MAWKGESPVSKNSRNGIRTPVAAAANMAPIDKKKERAGTGPAESCATMLGLCSGGDKRSVSTFRVVSLTERHQNHRSLGNSWKGPERAGDMHARNTPGLCRAVRVPRHRLSHIRTTVPRARVRPPRALVGHPCASAPSSPGGRAVRQRGHIRLVCHGSLDRRRPRLELAGRESPMGSMGEYGERIDRSAEFG